MLSRTLPTIALAIFGLPATAQSLAPPPVPDTIKVPEGNVAFLKALAAGTQNYVCLPSASGLVWKFQAPQATLYVAVKWLNREFRQQIATHYLSPNPSENGAPRATWRHSLDSSAVWAVKTAESGDPQYVAPGAIPWLLLQTVGAEQGPGGGAALAGTTYIQRVNTSGGAMPAGPCGEAGAIRFVPYTADYVFYRAAHPR